MIIYIVGIACVGKTTVGQMLAEKLGFQFYDLNIEIEKFYKKPIQIIQDQSFNMYEFRKLGSVVLNELLSKNIDAVIAGTPAGLKFSYLDVYKKHKKNKELYSIALIDAAENILKRITFYDKHSNPLIVNLNEAQKSLYLKEIKGDFNYFKSSYTRADLIVDIDNVELKDIPKLILTELQNKIENVDWSKIL